MRCRELRVVKQRLAGQELLPQLVDFLPAGDKLRLKPGVIGSRGCKRLLDIAQARLQRGELNLLVAQLRLQ